jgi:hypothetical protein
MALMKRLYDEGLFNASNTKALFELSCEFCSSTFLKSKKEILSRKIHAKRNKCDYCSIRCLGLSKRKKREVNCAQCGSTVVRAPSQISKNNFCNHSCAATHGQANKTKGNRRSKLEEWVEEQLTTIYPNLVVYYNSREAINSELDIYIPSLKIAFELNGIFHYEPIFGEEKLASIKNNDRRKFAACIEAGISLCLIDCSQHKYVKPKTSQKYLDIIVNIINEQISNLEG